MRTLNELMTIMPRAGRVGWIGTRPARRARMVSLRQAQALAESGLVGDHYTKPRGKRQVSLIQAEHLVVVAALLGLETVEPETLRRNLVVSGVNLLALKDKRFRVGAAILEYTGLCHPCSFMEEALGPGGYNAMRGHGGITARVIQSGQIALGDALSPVPAQAQRG